jgi:D-alanine--poly(phosphoribitol) ligase subunit 1
VYFDVAGNSFKEEDKQAAKTAFVAADKELSWGELKILSTAICETLEKTDVPKGHPVLIYGDKEAFFLAAILSCYRMSLPFVPINNSLPINRIEKIIRQTQSRVMIVCGAYENLPQIPIILKDDLRIYKKENTFFAKIPNAAYVLFTSGSSGEPKGVIISKKNIIAFTRWFTEEFPVQKKTIFINQADFLFDISLADFFGTLQTGGTCIFNTNEMARNTHSFFEKIKRYKGTYWNSTPSFVTRCFADKSFNSQHLPSITHFVLSGENLSTSLVKEMKNRFPKVAIINAYGPTETTIYASYVEIGDDLLSENILPICKEGSEGMYLEAEEIIIAGDRVGAGYLNNALTQQKFISYKEKRAFCTGDAAFVRNGYIYCAGRKDEQIKLNGYRIELAEIKNALESMHLIEQAECLPIIIDNKVKRLIAFVKAVEEINLSEIKNTLEKELPTYMIPSEIILRKEFPYTNSYKVDKQKLLNDYFGK